MNRAVHFSSGKDDWATPDEVFDPLNAEFGFTLDAAASNANTRCDEWYSEQCSALAVANWGGGAPVKRQTVWLNPPYSRGLQAKFITKAAEQATLGHTVVMLLPARTDTVAYHAHIWDREKHRPRPGVQVRFLKGRIKFVGAAHGAPFPSMVVVFDRSLLR